MSRNFLKKFFKNIFLYLIFSFIFIFNSQNSFGLQIVEVNNSASNNNDRWVKIFNDGSDISDFTISDFKTLDHKSTTKHGISSMTGGIDFPANSFAYISPSVNIPSGATKVFKSSYNIDRTNGYIEIINSDNTGVYHCLSFGSMVCPTNNFISYTADKSSSSTNSISTSTNSTSTSQNSATSTDTVTNTIYIYIPSNNQNKYGDINVLLPTEKVVPAGADTDFTVKVTDSQKNALSGLDFNWSFGDGGEKFGKDVTHHYTYPGEYTLIVTADGYLTGGQAKMIVTVISPNIQILKVGTSSQENFIDLKNNTDYDMYLSNFYLRIDGQDFKLPKNFVIAKNKVVHVSGEALSFKLPAVNVELLYPNKNSLVKYEMKIESSVATNTIETQIQSTASTSGILLEGNQIQTDYKKVNLLKDGDKASKLEVVKENISTSSITLKKLTLKNSDPVNTEQSSIKPSEISKKENEIQTESQSTKSKSVDTGIINWLKNLLY